MAAPAAEPFHEHMPRQALALAGWVAFWAAAEALLRGQGVDGPGQCLAFLAVTGAAAALAGRRLFPLLTSVRFAVTQGAFLIAAVALGMAAARAGGPAVLRSEAVFRSLWFCALLAALAASMLAVTWKRRPYDLSRLGFPLVHLAPSVVLLGALARLCGALVPGSWLIRTGSASFLLGCVWMFYLKPWLKRREARP
jgi:hypothetical protein